MRSLEIGPGKHPVNNRWDTLDIVGRPTYKHDILKRPWPVRSGSYDLVYMSHVLEHVPWFETVETLQEVRRILSPTGIVEIWVPNFAIIVESYLTGKMGDNWQKFNPDSDFMTWINGRLFSYGPNQNWHQATFDEAYLRRRIMEAGFHSTTLLMQPRGYDHGVVNLGIRAGR